MGLEIKPTMAPINPPLGAMNSGFCVRWRFLMTETATFSDFKTSTWLSTAAVSSGKSPQTACC